MSSLPRSRVAGTHRRPRLRALAAALAALLGYLLLVASGGPSSEAAPRSGGAESAPVAPTPPFPHGDQSSGGPLASR
jgi:hypothetical protein